MNAITKWNSISLRSLLYVAASAAFVSGCSDRPPTGVYGETTTLLQRVRSDYKALNLSPGESKKLTVTSYDAGDAIMKDSVSIRYTSSSTKRVTVDADGTVHAIANSEEPVSIIIAGTQGQVTQFDTVFVNVIDAPAAPAAKLAIHFEGDSTGLGAGSGNQVYGSLITASGDTLQDLLVVFTTKDLRVATASRYQRDTYVYGIAPGQTWLYGTATIGAMTFTDSVQIHVGWAAEAYFGWNVSRWGNGTLQTVLQPGGVVWWYNWGADMATGVTFEDPSAAKADTVGGPSGNILPFSGATNPRRFTKAGTYVWRTKDLDGNEQVGQIIVKENP